MNLFHITNISWLRAWTPKTSENPVGTWENAWASEDSPSAWETYRQGLDCLPFLRRLDLVGQQSDRYLWPGRQADHTFRHWPWGHVVALLGLFLTFPVNYLTCPLTGVRLTLQALCWSDHRSRLCIPSPPGGWQDWWLYLGTEQRGGQLLQRARKTQWKASSQCLSNDVKVSLFPNFSNREASTVQSGSESYTNVQSFESHKWKRKQFSASRSLE